jgi:hypothetical protein
LLLLVVSKKHSTSFTQVFGMSLSAPSQYGRCQAIQCPSKR